MTESAPGSDCPLCQPVLAPLIQEGTFWRLVLNWNQDRLGQVFLALRRHIELPTEVTIEEWNELREMLRDAIARERAAFSPDHFNVMFLGNEVRHLHLHIFPRYAGPRQAAGVVFSDPAWPDHYGLEPGPQLTGDQLEEVADLLRSAET
jgi:diadenosine tetraphosphate (Ap4A) HIT family hydrolase